MVHIEISRLAGKIGVKIEDRACDNGHVFDGQTIATHRFPLCWVETGKMDYSIPSYPMPEEICVRMPGAQPKYLSDHDLLHEVMHYLVAHPEQRDLPEFGLGAVGIFQQTHVSCVVDPEEATIQEKVVQLLCVYFGCKYNISVELSDEPFSEDFPCNSWQWYYHFKTKEDFPFEAAAAIPRAIAIIQELGE